MTVLKVAGSTTFTSTVSTVNDDILYDLPNSTSGTYTLHVDMSNMVAGDVLELRIYQKLHVSGTLRVAYYAVFTNAQPVDNNCQISVPISTDSFADTALRFALRQTWGAPRVYAWKVLSY